MNDIVERLRRDLMEISYDDIEAMVREAALVIERLRADNAILRNYLREIQSYANLALIDERQDSEILPPD